MTRLVCVAGAESTGKSWLVDRLAAHFGCPAVSEYARDYCAAHGNALTLAQLAHVAATQDGWIRRACAAAPGKVILADTDALVTGVWAETTLGAAPDAFVADSLRPDLYLVTANDLPWQDDGVRRQSIAADRDRFLDRLCAAIDRRGVARSMISDHGDARLMAAIAAVRNMDGTSAIAMDDS